MPEALSVSARGVQQTRDFNAPFLPASAITLSEEDALYKRFSNKAAYAKYTLDNVVCELTRDKGYLHQYYLLREQMYTQVWQLRHFEGQKDEFDEHSHVIVARVGNQVVGGARLTTKSPRQLDRLPMESDDFLLEKLLPEFNLEYVKYCEVSRLAILPEFGAIGVGRKIYLHLIRKGISLGTHYGFFIAPLVQARNYRAAHSVMGLTSKILTHIKVPEREEYEGIRMSLSCLDLTAFVRRQSREFEVRELDSVMA